MLYGSQLWLAEMMRPLLSKKIMYPYLIQEEKECPLYFILCTQDILVGLLRLRKCGRNVTCPELMGKCSIVRELHVYGTAVPVHGRDADKLQHQVMYMYCNGL